MLNLLTKSKQNSVAISFLIDKELYAPVAHCAYYACIQKIIHILEEYYPVEFEAEKKSVRGGSGNNHKVYIELITHFVRESNIDDAKKIKNLLRDLRIFRLDSDYKIVAIGKTNTEDIRLKHQVVLRIIRKHFKL